MSLDTNTPVSSMTYNGTPLRMAVENAVLYTEQSLTDEQKEQARGNIGAPSESSVFHEIPTVTFKTGDNLLTGDIVTLGAGWSGSLATGFTHTAGNTEPLIFNINSADGERYIVSGSFSSISEHAIQLKIGNSYPSDPYGKNPFVWGVQSIGGGSLSITPINDSWAGTIFDLECRKITDDGENEVTVYLDALGHDDLQNHISGFWDIQMGVDVLKNSVNTTRCIGIGNYSLNSLKTGGRNIGLGTFALPVMEYGENNISIGADSGFKIKKATDCIIIGKAAMQYGKNLTSNVAIGASALYGYENKDDTESYNNVAIGDSAGYKNGSHNNIFLGRRAGYFNNDYGNVFIGSGAGGDANYSSTGNRLVVIGQAAGVSAGKNAVTVIGTNAKGLSSNSTAIGYNAIANNVNQTVIGYGTIGDKANQVVLGNDSVVETLVKGDLVVRGTDGVKRQIVFNADGTCSWTGVSE